MNDEPDDQDTIDPVAPAALGLADGEIVIFNTAEFEQDFNCYAAQMRGTDLFVLCKARLKWVNAEGHEDAPDEATSAKPPRSIRSVQ